MELTSFLNHMGSFPLVWSSGASETQNNNMIQTQTVFTRLRNMWFNRRTHSTRDWVCSLKWGNNILFPLFSLLKGFWRSFSLPELRTERVVSWTDCKTFEANLWSVILGHMNKTDLTSSLRWSTIWPQSSSSPWAESGLAGVLRSASSSSSSIWGSWEEGTVMKVSLLKQQRDQFLSAHLYKTNPLNISDHLPPAGPSHLTHLMFGCLRLQVSGAGVSLGPRLFLMVLVIWESNLHTNTQLHTHTHTHTHTQQIHRIIKSFTDRQISF